MKEIELRTGGEFVSTVEVLPFTRPPQVVMWGDRVFTWTRRQSPAGLDVYEETFAEMSLTPSPGLPQREPPAPPPVDRAARAVVGEAVAPGVPDTSDRGDGQQRGYVILSDEERAKGFVRPVRRTYRHVGRPGRITDTQSAGGCGSTTTMGRELAETYARAPTFYGGTFCCACGGHFPVGANGEFVWEGTDQRVGT